MLAGCLAAHHPYITLAAPPLPAPVTQHGFAQEMKKYQQQPMPMAPPLPLVKPEPSSSSFNGAMGPVGMAGRAQALADSYGMVDSPSLSGAPGAPGGGRNMSNLFGGDRPDPVVTLASSAPLGSAGAGRDSLEAVMESLINAGPLSNPGTGGGVDGVGSETGSGKLVNHMRALQAQQQAALAAEQQAAAQAAALQATLQAQRAAQQDVGGVDRRASTVPGNGAAQAANAESRGFISFQVCTRWMGSCPLALFLYSALSLPEVCWHEYGSPVTVSRSRFLTVSQLFSRLLHPPPSQDYEFTNLEFLKPTRMNKVFMVFTINIAGLDDLIYVAFNVPTIGICRAEQREKACKKLNIDFKLLSHFDHAGNNSNNNHNNNNNNNNGGMHSDMSKSLALRTNGPLGSALGGLPGVGPQSALPAVAGGGGGLSVSRLNGGSHSAGSAGDGSGEGSGSASGEAKATGLALHEVGMAQYATSQLQTAPGQQQQMLQQMNALKQQQQQAYGAAQQDVSYQLQQQRMVLAAAQQQQQQQGLANGLVQGAPGSGAGNGLGPTAEFYMAANGSLPPPQSSTAGLGMDGAMAATRKRDQGPVRHCGCDEVTCCALVLRSVASLANCRV